MSAVHPPPARVDTRHPQYQELKSRVHQGLLNRLNLERLTRVRREDAEPEIRGLIWRCWTPRAARSRSASSSGRRSSSTSSTSCSASARSRHCSRDPEISDILVNRFDQVYIERDGILEPVDVVVQGRRAPAADHRAHRQLGRPPHRRVEPDGGRPAGRRLARERDHPAARARRPGAVDPPLPHRPARRRRTWSSATR